jgi:outer membrane receptor for ferrienterochelin and colicin
MLRKIQLSGTARAMRTVFLLAVLFCCLPGGITGSAYAAFLSTTGKISGRALNAKTGEALPSITVILQGTTLGAASDMNGYYSINNVSPGTYTVRASAVGYTPVLIKSVKVNIDLTTKLDIKLEDNTVQLSDVVVTASRPMVQKDLTASTSIIAEDLINNLPVTEMRDILQLQAGMTVSGGDLHLRGGRKGQIAYQIDGVPVTDVYDGSNIIDVGANSIQELQVVSGAFNAEFGQAMSGIVNIVTKDGNNKLSGNLQLYSGIYLSPKDDIFWGISKVHPLNIKNIEGSLSGAIIPDGLFFYTYGRAFENEGYLYGKRKYLTTDLSQMVRAGGSSAYVISENGDGSMVAMNPTTRYNGQGKLSYHLGDGMKLSYNYIRDYQFYQDFNMANRLTPDNQLNQYRKGNTNTLGLNHALSANTFYTLNLSYFTKDYRNYLYENIYTGDPSHPTNYVDYTLQQNPPYSYPVGGDPASGNRFVRTTGTYAAKFDLTTQLSQEFQVQFGADAKQHRIYMEHMYLVPVLDASGAKVVPYNVEVGSINSLNYDTYLHRPQEFSGYLQSKFEAYSLIFNIGLRFDYYNPDGVVLSDPEDPEIVNPIKPENKAKTLAERETYWYKKASDKSAFSPRIGLAFPFSDRGVIHFSYGHFFQLPAYETMYENPRFKLADIAGSAGVVGNADLKPQKTTKGEIGVQQQLSEDISIDGTMFFEDFRDLIGTSSDEIAVFGQNKTYSRYANSDFGFSKGVIVRLAKKFGDGLTANLDYTYSVTKGNASDPSDARNAILGGQTPETFIAPLNWDQTHTLNLVVAYAKERDYGFSCIGNLYSGQPYTPSVNVNTNVAQNAFPKNSATKPTIFNIDLRAYKNFNAGSVTFTLFVNVYNVLDRDNPLYVNADSGDPFFSFAKYEAEKINPRLYNVSSLDEYYTNPGLFSQPRRVELGASVNF